MKRVGWIIGASMLLGLGGVPRTQQASASDESKLQNRIAADLRRDPELKNNTIDLSVYREVATLKGTVDTKAERLKAEQIARADGAPAVDNQLSVGSLGAKAAAIPDSTVTANVIRQLAADDTLRHADMSVTTSNGVVTFKGIVPSDQARIRAIDTARRTIGVSRVEDDLQVANPAPAPFRPTERNMPLEPPK